MIRYACIIWDWNGTLLDDAWLCREVMNGALSQRGLPELSEERYQAVFDFPVIDYYRRVGFDLEKEPFEKVGAEFIEEYERRRPECGLHQEARSMLDTLHAGGILQTVLSAYEHESLLSTIEHFELTHYFDLVQGLDHIYADGKLEIGRRLIDTLHVEPQDCLLIGDTVHDHEVALELGVDCRLIPRGNHTREKLASCGVPVYRSLHEVLEET